MSEQTEMTDSNADLGSRLYWLALLAGLLVGLLGAAFHGLIDRLTAWRSAFVAGDYDQSAVVQLVVQKKK